MKISEMLACNFLLRTVSTGVKYTNQGRSSLIFKYVLLNGQNLQSIFRVKLNK